MSALGREVELARATLPAGAQSREAAAAHWQRAVQIGCVNFGCDDVRVKEWIRSAALAGGDREKSLSAPLPAIAPSKPYEAQYALAVDILARAQAVAPASDVTTQ